MQYPIVSSIIAHIDAYIYQLSSFDILAVPSPENIHYLNHPILCVAKHYEQCTP